MKFKFLIIALDVTIVFFLLIIAFLPFLVMGADFVANFWNMAWPIALFLVMLLIGINVFFLLKYRVYSLLEREDWPALVYHLEEKVFGKGQYSASNVRLLANAYLVLGDPPSVLKLENKVAVAKPGLLEKNALVFGAARLLGGSHREAADFFRTHLERSKTKTRLWLRWYYGFSQILAGAFVEAEPEFITLAADSDDALITGLSAYFLGTTLANHSSMAEECRSVSESGRNRVRNSLKNANGWKKETTRAQTEIHAAIIRKYIDAAGAWVFG